MRTFDFAPFYRSTVGFDRLFSMLDQVAGVEGAAAPGYPPYNIKQSGENAYNISVAVAGFAEADLSIEVKENTLTIRGNKQGSGDQESDNLIYQALPSGILNAASSSPTMFRSRARAWRTGLCRSTSCGWSQTR
jgi:molecular chaperone IbpA